MDYFFIFIAEYLIYIATVYAVLYVLLMRKSKEYVQHILIVILSAVSAWVVAHLLKNIIAHPRPDLALALVVPDSVYSFPSGHATYAFALAWAMYYFDKQAAKILFIMAFFVGIGRVLVGVHYWYDVLGGFVVGALIASGVVHLVRVLRK